MKSIKYYYALAVVILSTVMNAPAQEKQDEADLFDLSIEELMNVKIVSASKTEETLFDAPLSSYTLTRTEIARAGSTTIMEALRLVPGLIVREVANGVYDIHIRGFDNILQVAGHDGKINTIMLVMVNDRPVFNHNLGGTFWETLPVDLGDVERIEVVRGPAAPLFGPNAVSGVINIITRNFNNKSALSANIQAGPNASLASVLAGTKQGNFSFGASGNYQLRNRFDSEYFQNSTGNFVNVNELTASPLQFYPNQDVAYDKWAVNGMGHYQINPDNFIEATLGTQSSEVQKNLTGGNDTKFTTLRSETQYADARARLKNLLVKVSYTAGRDNLNVGTSPGKYDYNVANADAEYTWTKNQTLSVVPGISYQSSNFSDLSYNNVTGNANGGFFNREVNLTTLSGFVRGDLKVGKARGLVAVRLDKFSRPDKIYPAFELAATYKLGEKNITRIAITRSNSGSFMAYNYLNVIVPIFPGLDVRVMGNDDLQLMTVTMGEIGWRSNLSNSIQIDMDVFVQQASNFTAMLGQIYNPMIGTYQQSQFGNLPTTANQYGFTGLVKLAASRDMQIKAFVTLQQTMTNKLPSKFVDPDYEIVTYSNVRHTNTPTVYGGYYLDYSISKKTHLNLNGYYFSTHRQYDFTDVNNDSSTGNVKGKVLLNAKLSWDALPSLTIFANVRNALGNRSREYFGTDRPALLALAGLTFEL